MSLTMLQGYHMGLPVDPSYMMDEEFVPVNRIRQFSDRSYKDYIRQTVCDWVVPTPLPQPYPDPHLPISKVDKLDLSKVKMKLCWAIDQEGKGWTKDQADRVEFSYRQFLKLAVMGYEKVAPLTKEIDDFWHGHILYDTKQYHLDCLTICGKYIHHYGYCGLPGMESETLETAKQTHQLYLEHFGESPLVINQDGMVSLAKCARCVNGGCDSGSNKP